MEEGKSGRIPIRPRDGVAEAIRRRRSVKRFTGRPIPREVIEELLELAVLAPNHRMTEPWRFVVLGPSARRGFGELKGRERAARVDQPQAASRILERTIAQMEAVPSMIAFLQQLADEPEVREEDFATVYMGMENLLLAAVARGLGTHVKTGAIFETPEVRELIGARAEERVVALVHLGEPAELPDPRPRRPASQRTRWID